MEIERRWLVDGWPALEPAAVVEMEQGYFLTHPAVRIRRETRRGGPAAYVICFKGGAGLVREEIEVAVDQDRYLRLRSMLLTSLAKGMRERRQTFLGGRIVSSR